MKLSKLWSNLKRLFRNNFEESVIKGALHLKDNGVVPPADWAAFEAGVTYALAKYKEDRKNTHLLILRLKENYLELYYQILQRKLRASPNDEAVLTETLILIEDKLDALFKALE